MSYFSLLRCFSERPFRSGTSSLSYFFSEQPLIWATSALICLPASSSVASVTHDLRGAVTINAFSALQLQPRLLGASQHHSCCPACSCVIAFSHKLQWHWGRFRATRRYSDPISLSRFFALGTVSCTFCQPHLPRVSLASSLCDFDVQIELSPQSCALFVGDFPSSSLGNKDPPSAAAEATLREKNTQFRIREIVRVFFREFTHSRTVTLPN